MDMQTWEAQVPEHLKHDAIWRRQDYRLARYLADTAWPDAAELDRHRVTRDIGAQLYKAIGDIPSHLAEGYSRGSVQDRVRFYEYALGSAREAREWYARGVHILGVERVRERSEYLTSILRLLLTVIPGERSQRGALSFNARTKRGKGENLGA